jgi:hypothetical protein
LDGLHLTFVVAPNLIVAERIDGELAESRIWCILRCHKLCETRPHTRGFRSFVAKR